MPWKRQRYHVAGVAGHLKANRVRSVPDEHRPDAVSTRPGEGHDEVAGGVRKDTQEAGRTGEGPPRPAADHNHAPGERSGGVAINHGSLHEVGRAGGLPWLGIGRATEDQHRQDTCERYPKAGQDSSRARLPNDSRLSGGPAAHLPGDTVPRS